VVNLLLDTLAHSLVAFGDGVDGGGVEEILLNRQLKVDGRAEHVHLGHEVVGEGLHVLVDRLHRAARRHVEYAHAVCLDNVKVV